MASEGLLAIAIEDPLCEAGAVLAGIGGMLWWREEPVAVTLSFVAAGLVLLLIGGRRAFTLARVGREGREVVALVTGVRQSWPYRLSYVFRDPQGHEITGSRFLSKQDALRWRRGDTGKVRYDPENSARHAWVIPDADEALFEAMNKPRGQLDAPAAEATRPAPVTRAMLKRRVVFGGAGNLYSASIVGIGLLMALVMLASLQSLVPPILVVGVGAVLGVAALVIQLVRKAVQNAQRVRNVLERGIVTQGSVIGMNEARMKRGLFSQSLGWDISYSYKDRRGSLHMGESGRLSRTQAMRYRIGDSCEVVFDPDEPESSFWVSRD